MASKERDELLQEAQNVGLVEGVDYNKNISNKNLEKKIEDKKEEIAATVKGTRLEHLEGEATLIPLERFEEDKDKLEEYGKSLGIDLDKRRDIEGMYEDLVDFFSNGSTKDPNGADDIVDSEANESTEDEKANSNSNPDDTQDSKQDDGEGETYEEDELEVRRFSKCGNYKADIKGLKEAARRSGVTIEEIKESLETGEPVSNGFTFKEV